MIIRYKKKQIEKTISPQKFQICFQMLYQNLLQIK